MKIAQELVDLCKQGKNMEAVERLYAQNVVSIEAATPQGQGMERQVNGLEAVKAKGKWWEENHEVHNAKIEGPWPHGENKFAVRFAFDVTNKQQNQRMQLDEIAVYSVESDKIVREEFFYAEG